MGSKQTGGSRSAKTQVPEDWFPTPAERKSEPSAPGNDEISEWISNRGSTGKKVVDDGIIQSEESIGSADSLQTIPAGYQAATSQTAPRRTGSRQRKESLEDYRQTFLTVPKLEDRKPVFVSREVRDKLDEIVRRLGGRRMSVSGFIENLARHHLEMYRDDFEVWKKL